MSRSPLKTLGEVFGKIPSKIDIPFALKPAPQCPFRTEVYDAFHKNSGRIKWKNNCNKASPTCSVYQGVVGPTRADECFTDPPVITCPSRFLQKNIIQDIARIAWGKEHEADFYLATEVSIGGKWQVDLALYEKNLTTNEITDFCSAEIQAIDITNNVTKYVEAFRIGADVEDDLKQPGFNWANATIKRLFTQLLFKGYMHHVWGKKLAVIIQDKTLDYIEETVTLATVPTMEKANICILPYRYEQDPDNNDQYRLELVEDRVKRMPYGSFALSTLSIKLPDVLSHQDNFFARTL